MLMIIYGFFTYEYFNYLEEYVRLNIMFILVNVKCTQINTLLQMMVHGKEVNIRGKLGRGIFFHLFQITNSPQELSNSKQYPKPNYVASSFPYHHSVNILTKTNHKNKHICPWKTNNRLVSYQQFPHKWCDVKQFSF